MLYTKKNLALTRLTPTTRKKQKFLPALSSYCACNFFSPSHLIILSLLVFVLGVDLYYILNMTAWHPLQQLPSCLAFVSSRLTSRFPFFSTLQLCFASWACPMIGLYFFPHPLSLSLDFNQNYPFTLA